MLAGRLDFSDGSSTSFGPLDNDAANGTEVRFPAKTVSWMKVTLTEVSPKTVNSGLSEIAVFQAPGAQKPVHL